MALLLVVLVVVPATVGCQRDSDASGGGARPVAEESFDFIVSMFKRAVETGAGGISDGLHMSLHADGHTRLVVDNNVTYRIIPPTTGQPNYRAVITVTSRADYSLQRLEVKEGDEGNSGKSADSNAAPDGFWSGSQGAEILDNDLVTPGGNPGRPIREVPEEIVSRRSDETVKNYDLEFENGRWVLKTELDPDTERAIANAFQHALSYQK